MGSIGMEFEDPFTGKSVRTQLCSEAIEFSGAFFQGLPVHLFTFAVVWPKDAEEDGSGES